MLAFSSSQTGYTRFSRGFEIRFLIIIALLLLAVRSLGQDASSGALRGSVLDPDAGAIPGATVVLVNSARGLRYSATSDAEGRFAFELLPPGPGRWIRASLAIPIRTEMTATTVSRGWEGTPFSVPIMRLPTFA